MKENTIVFSFFVTSVVVNKVGRLQFHDDNAMMCPNIFDYYPKNRYSEVVE